MNHFDYLNWIEVDPARELNEMKSRLLAQGGELFDLSMINPDLSPPRILIDKLLEASWKTQNHRYAVSRGVRKLREGFAEKYARRFGVTLDPELEVCAVMGSKDALVHAFDVLTQPGDTILVGAPTYPLYLSSARLSRLKCEFFQIQIDEDAMLVDIERAIKSNPIKVIVLNFPNNPTGVAVGLPFYQKLYRMVEGRGIFVLNDFVYGEMSFGGTESVSLLSVPEFRSCAAETYSMSKAYSVPGWRVGALSGNSLLVRKLARLKSQIDYGLFLPLQYAAAAGLSTDTDIVSSTLRQYERRARALSGGLQRLGWEAALPEGGVCLWCRIPESIRGSGSIDFAKRLLQGTGVLVMPGMLFGAAFDDFVRFALVQSEDRIVQLLARIEECFPVSQPGHLADSVDRMSIRA